MHFFKKIKTHYFLSIGSSLLLLILLIAFLGPLCSPHDYQNILLENKNLAPDRYFWFGSDDLGRDIFTRTCHGARLSIAIGFLAALIDMCIGVTWGALAGYVGGNLDLLMMRLADILYALPYLLVVILILMLLGPGFFSLLIAMTVIGWINMARLVRSQVLQVKQQNFVLAARALGANWPRLLWHHILPHLYSSIIVTLTMTIPAAIFAETFLSFLGLGLQAPLASLGTLASEGLPAMTFYPWRLFFPAFFISFIILAFNFIGEGLRRLLNIYEIP